MSISRNQIEALRDGYLNKIGSGDYKIVNSKTLPILEKVLIEYGIAFNDAIQENLENSGSISSGKLAETSLPVITKFGNKYTLSLGYPKGSSQLEYFDYINKGVKGYTSGSPSNTPYSFKNPYPNRKMAANIFSWLNKARKSVRTDSVNTNKKGEISATETKRQSLKKALTESAKKKSLAYAISSSIKQKGIKPTKYFDNAISQVFNKQFTNDVAYAIISDMAVKIAGNLTKETKGN